MDILLGLMGIFILLVISILKNVFIGYPLLGGFLYFCVIAYKKGHSLRSILSMALKGGQQSFVVLRIFILVGGLTGIWMASGTVQTIMYYGVKYMNYDYILIYAFLICGLVSYLLGTSLGSVSTVGIIFILIGKGAGLDLNLIAGAVMSGAYLGDRTSPMASSANLVASLTNTDLHNNVKNMVRTTLMPMSLTLLLYYLVREKNVAISATPVILQTIEANYTIGLATLLPALAVFLLSITKTNIRYSMLISIIVSIMIAYLYQGISIFSAIKVILIGYQLPVENPLATIFINKGILGMFPPASIILISCALAGVFHDTNMLKNIENLVRKANNRVALYCYTIIVSVFTSAFGCSQSIATIMTFNIMKASYANNDIDDSNLALDLENSGVVIAPLLPWNIAAFVATTTMGVSRIGYIPYAFYLFVLPLVNLIMLYLKQIPKDKMPMPKYYLRPRRIRNYLSR